jgi:uncharacterized protein with PIN domain
VRGNDPSGRGRFPVKGMMLCLLLVAAGFSPLSAQENDECLACHGDKSAATERNGRSVSLFVDAKALSGSKHADVPCVGCHADLAGTELPHEDAPGKVDCGTCHASEAADHAASLHGQAIRKGDHLAPRCSTCHGTHDILNVKDPRSHVAPQNVPYLCGGCHREGSPVSRQYNIPQANILENYSESMHGEALLKKGLIVTATCVSCHTAHRILPHTDARSSINRKNIASTCTHCHSQIEIVHRKVIRGELWEKQSHVLPACVDCHQPHKVRKVFYDQGMADADCMRCHGRDDVRSSKDNHSLKVNDAEVKTSKHAKVACSQCHSEVNASHSRPCETITKKVDCSACHAEVGQQYQRSTHGLLAAKDDPNAPRCFECHGTHGILGKTDPKSATFPTNIPNLCARCHREGQKAAVRYAGPEHDIIDHYQESIHGKGLLKSGLTVTATCTDCHTAHGVLPISSPESSVNPKNVPATCGKCHHGIEDQFNASIHVTAQLKPGQRLPVCNDCHSAHTIKRADNEGFKLTIMTQCGQCHEEIAKTYFDTYHGKVSQLGYTKTAKCYDCHGAHDIQKVTDPRSHLSHDNVVETCKKCHANATRQFAGYLTHATHHDPKKYPFLFFTFWGMTFLLVGTFVLSGVHTLLWLPRALQMRRARTKRELPDSGKEPPREEE